NPGAAYASNVNAVIRIKTLPPKGEGFGFDITNTLNAWSYARNTTDINMRYRRNSFEVFGNLYINEGKRKYEDISKITTFSSDTFLQSIYNHSTMPMHSLFGKIGFSYMLSPQHSIGAYYRFGRSKWDNRGGIETESSIVNDKAATTVENTSGLYTSTAKDYPSQEANVYYNGKIGELSLDFNADFMQDRSDNYENHRDFLPGNDTPERNVYVDGLTKNRLLAEKLVASYPVGKGSLEIGEEYTDSRLSYDYDYAGAPIGDSFTDINERNFAGFATLSQTFGKWNVSVGLRYEYAKYQYHDEDLPNDALSRTYNNLFPSLSMSTKLGKVRLSLDFSTRMKRPSYRKLDGRVAYLNRYVYQSGNPLLKPTKGYNVQAMATWKYFYAVLTYKHEVDAVFNTTRDYEKDPMVKVITYMNVPHYQYVQLYIGAQPTFGCWQPSPAIGMLKQFCTLNYKGVETSFNKPMYFFTLGNIFSLPKSWQIGADLWLYSASNSQNCYVKPTQQLSLSIRKSFFNDNLMLQLKGVDLLDRATNKVTIYSGDIENYMYTHHEPRNITFT
ncbi:MAG: outer membrane beta-barrel family protein, partial [Muribaculaceae bacterium]|nr:outer membrane beta-barrel family protein [Muribaculaceae bacterium]